MNELDLTVPDVVLINTGLVLHLGTPSKEDREMGDDSVFIWWHYSAKILNLTLRCHPDAAVGPGFNFREGQHVLEGVFSFFLSF